MGTGTWTLFNLQWQKGAEKKKIRDDGPQRATYPELYCEFEKDSVLPGYIEGFPHINESTKGYKRYGDQHASLFANVDG